TATPSPTRPPCTASVPSTPAAPRSRRQARRSQPPERFRRHHRVHATIGCSSSFDVLPSVADTGKRRTFMTSESANLPAAVDRAAFQAELDTLRVREKAHTREGDAIAAARRRLPMVEVDASLELTGPDGPVTLLDAFEGRRQLIAYYFMWWPGHPAADQCEGCTWVTTQVRELSYLHSRDITFAVFCQGRNVTYDTPP